MTLHQVRQGGDVRSLAPGVLDLSTCVNLNGPPPAVRAYLREANPADLLKHPFAAVDGFTTTYARHLGVEADEITASRGITELLWALSRVLPASVTSRPSVDYTDIHDAFSYHRVPEGVAIDRGEQIRRLSRVAEFLVISNPCNPTGLALTREELEAIARDSSNCTLVVDESYVDFCEEPALYSLIGTELFNVAVLRSPTKFYGIGGVRAGGLWTRNRRFAGNVARQITKWPLSTLDVLLVEAALSDGAWADTTRREMQLSARTLECCVASLPDAKVLTSPTHFRFLECSPARAVEIGERLLDQGIAVRTKRPSEGVSGIRITAPPLRDLDRLTAALSQIQ
ncbi:aminotransferase class I/II-fold pyridoxal phosphate-dependent enzyme [Caulobacter sp. KR2-114]|uniref:aminotransferase class I/II-fold pyridoxal phosphate-dependent enzyme n=1 Tax=Caulobacter sp. KR2-114 TaxID=3400912 RepID=UPI003BFE8BE1